MFFFGWNLVCGHWTTIWQKTTYNEFKIATAIFWLTTTTQTTAEATGGAGIRGSRAKGSEGPHHHQQDFTIFSLRQEPPLLVITTNFDTIPLFDFNSGFSKWANLYFYYQFQMMLSDQSFSNIEYFKSTVIVTLLTILWE